MKRALILAVVLLAGCRSIESQVQGDWSQEKSSSSGAEMFLNAMMPSAKLSLNSDHSFALTMPSLSIEVRGNASNVSLGERIEGTWSMSEREVVFTTSTTGGKPIADAKKEMEDKKAKADEAARNTQAWDLQRRQQRALAGYVEPPDSSLPPGVQASASFDLVLPDRAKLSDDGKRLTLRFQNNASAPIDLGRG